MKTDKEPQLDEVGNAIRLMCSTSVGPFESSFLCQSLSALKPREPLCVALGTSLKDVVSIFQSRKQGAVLIVDSQRHLIGIFSERDFVLKLGIASSGYENMPVEQFMTKDPVSQTSDCTVAFALNLMSHGGFRHIPIVDDENVPIGIISVRDVVDGLVHSMTEKLLAFDAG